MKRSLAVLLLAVLLGCSPPPPLPKGQGGPLATPGLMGTPAPSPGTSAREIPTVAPTVETQVGEVPTEVSALAQQLVATSSTERDKALALYDWIGKNIRYDLAARQSGDLPDPSPEIVLAQRSAVCEGYARLFMAMAGSVGLEAVMVPGYSKGFAPDEDKAKPDHAWNAVKLNGEWALLDPTWGAGHVDQSQTFVAEFNRDWFDTPPEQFAASHLPVDEKWQLMSPALDTATFWARPSLSTSYFDYQLNLDSHPKGKIESDGLLEMRFSSGRDTHLMATLKKGNADLAGSHAMVERQGRTFTVSVRPPEAGHYRLIIFAGPPESTQAESAVVYELTARSGSDDVFPKTMKTFSDEQVQLVSPRTGLRDGSDTELVLEAPGATKLMAVIGERQIPFERDGARFSVRLVPQGDKVGVFGSYDDSARYSGLLEFPVAR